MRKSTGRTNRDLGFNSHPGQNGKGDAERSIGWRNNLAEISFPGVVGFERGPGNKLVKRYGASAPIRFANAPSAVIH